MPYTTPHFAWEHPWYMYITKYFWQKGEKTKIISSVDIENILIKFRLESIKNSLSSYHISFTTFVVEVIEVLRGGI